MFTLVENIIDNLFKSLPFPNSNVIYLLILDDNAPEITANIATIPPTTLYIPKFSTPKVLSTIRLVNNDMTITRMVRIYNRRVFFATLVLFDVFPIVFTNLQKVTIPIEYLRNQVYHQYSVPAIFVSGHFRHVSP